MTKITMTMIAIHPAQPIPFPLRRSSFSFFLVFEDLDIINTLEGSIPNLG
jgi:hypothetical protein